MSDRNIKYLSATPYSIKLHLKKKKKINKHYHGLTDYRLAGAAPFALIPARYRTDWTDSLRYKTTITLLVSPAEILK